MPVCGFCKTGDNPLYAFLFSGSVLFRRKKWYIPGQQFAIRHYGHRAADRRSRALHRSFSPGMGNLDCCNGTCELMNLAIPLIHRYDRHSTGQDPRE